MPIMQWLYFDALECLAEEDGVLPTEEECTPVSVHSKTCAPFFSIGVGDEHKWWRYTCLSLSLPEKLPVRWTDCGVWHKAAGYAWQTAVLPGESANGNFFQLLLASCC